MTVSAQERENFSKGTTYLFVKPLLPVEKEDQKRRNEENDAAGVTSQGQVQRGHHLLQVLAMIVETANETSFLLI